MQTNSTLVASACSVEALQALAVKYFYGSQIRIEGANPVPGWEEVPAYTQTVNDGQKWGVLKEAN